MRLIDADALIENARAFEATALARGCGKSILTLARVWLFNEVRKAPTIDAVEVVRCKDCKHLYFKDMSAYCPFKVSACRPNDFCSRGERR